MKKYLLILILIPKTILIFSQENKPFPFNEFSVSINRTNLKDDNTENKIGFGIGTYHTFLSEKKINLKIGIEYNRTSQLKKYVYESHFANSSDVYYYINSISIPFTTKINFGNKAKLLIETGLFTDLNIGAKRKGTMHSYLPYLKYTESKFEENTQISAINYGFSVGIGINVPLFKYRLTIKPEYKYGVHELYDYGTSIFNKYYRIILGIQI
ncbi:MAG: hypothetical protein HYU68_05195 [Bacteroidetes bacterium]|nr:hypothetical protein [Bacteroidota bacterium]